MLTIQQIATLLGVSRITVRRYWAAGLIPEPVKLGRTVRWRKSDIDQWLENRCPPCAAATEAAVH
jgi:excisionase family DNA binding protein